MRIDPRDAQTWTVLSQTTRAERLLLVVLGRLAAHGSTRPVSAPPQPVVVGGSRAG